MLASMMIPIMFKNTIKRTAKRNIIQARMMNHQMSAEAVERLFARSKVGVLATINPDGTPYITPIHFINKDGAIYFHGLPAGQKISNLKANPNICFNVYEMDKLLFDPNEKPYDTNTKYESITIQGTVNFIQDLDKKREILGAIVCKYTPQLAGREFPQNMLKGTAVLEITPQQTTGKYFC